MNIIIPQYQYPVNRINIMLQPGYIMNYPDMMWLGSTVLDKVKYDREQLEKQLLGSKCNKDKDIKEEKIESEIINKVKKEIKPEPKTKPKPDLKPKIKIALKPKSTIETKKILVEAEAKKTEETEETEEKVKETKKEEKIDETIEKVKEIKKEEKEEEKEEESEEETKEESVGSALLNFLQYINPIEYIKSIGNFVQFNISEYINKNSLSEQTAKSLLEEIKKQKDIKKIDKDTLDHFTRTLQFVNATKKLLINSREILENTYKQMNIDITKPEIQDYLKKMEKGTKDVTELFDLINKKKIVLSDEGDYVVLTFLEKLLENFVEPTKKDESKESWYTYLTNKLYGSYTV